MDAQRVLDSLAVGVLLLAPDGRVAFLNREAARLAGVPPEAALGRNAPDLFGPDLAGPDSPIIRVLRLAEPSASLTLTLGLPGGACRARAVACACPGPSGRGAVLALTVLDDPAACREQEPSPAFSDIVGQDARVLRLLASLPPVAESDAAILLTGETGTGKDVFAKAVHAISRRRNGPFIKINCAALPDSLLESELFGYRKGAFTDAKKDKPGMFEMARGGSIFLDEIGDLSPELQAKLLQVLEDKEYYPLGSAAPRTADVRIISATNRRLAEAVAKGRFRPDLYYRLRVVEMELPPLRERPGDVPLLMDHFLRTTAKAYGKDLAGFAPEARTMLHAYDYPGNIRELKHIVEHAVILAKDRLIQVRDLPRSLRNRHPAPETPPGDPLAEGERKALVEALAANSGNVTLTARALGLSRTTLWRKMKKHSLTAGGK